MVILRKSEPRLDDYTPYFRQVDVESFSTHGVRYWIVRGQGFRYAAYHDKVLTRIRQRFYRIPEWLPQRGCAFCDRYFPDGQ